MPELELIEPSDDWMPELVLLEPLDELEPVDDVEVELELEVLEAEAVLAVPGIVEALTAAKTPVAANASIATPAVSWLISLCAPSRAEIRALTVWVIGMSRSSPPELTRF